MSRHGYLTRSFLAAAVTAAATTMAISQEPLLDDAVRARRAVERVYWAHRIWPADNAAAKPRFEDVVPDAVVRARVEDFWRESNALGGFWARPLTDAALQAELDRIAAATRAPDVLQEIFDALGNDPERIVDALVRPILADRMAREAFGGDAGFDAWWRDARDAFEASPSLASHRFTLPKIGGTPCAPLTWTSMSGSNGPPPGSALATAVWTGSEMIVWGGSRAGSSPYGSRYDPATDAWAPMTSTGEPTLREQHSAVWTGSEMIVWGGTTDPHNPVGGLNTGGRYNPSTDTWTATAVVASTPEARRMHTAVWAGSRMIVWGGWSAVFPGPTLNTGAQYDPATDSWVATAVGIGTPVARAEHVAVSTGTRMIVWGGTSGSSQINSGSVYDPATDSWSATKLQGAPAARLGASAVWSGTEMIVWGGIASSATNTGGRYDPAQNKWTTTSTGANVPAARYSHTAVWTGSRMLVWGGTGATPDLGSGARYDPVADAWTSITMAGAPQARSSHVAVWTGSRFVVWGGWINADPLKPRLDNGGRYDPVADSWTPTAIASEPRRSLHTATWTGSELIVFGGINSAAPDYLAAPRRYDPATDSWSPASSVSAPSPRRSHTAVWTGTDLIIWGGFGGTQLGDGARYDPALDAWTPLPAAGAPSPRMSHTAVWTGRRMVVWGGAASPNTNTGALFDPMANAWSPTSTGANVPTARSGHSAVWTGHEMVVFGGAESGLSTGGRYDPVQNTWRTVSSTGAATARSGHSAVWTGTKMIVWGGLEVGVPAPTNTGGAYDPFTDAWTATSTSGAVPSPRSGHTFVWTGTQEMVVWGGNSSGNAFGNGGRYEPVSDTWTALDPGGGSPSVRSGHAAAWTGSEMLVWGGASAFNGEFLNTGAGLCLASCASPGIWHPDVDGDGFGAIGVDVRACAQPPGHVASSGDCDDRRANVHPGAVESCNALDDDCDDAVDEGFPVAGSPGLSVDHSGQTALLRWTPAGGVLFDIVDGSLEFMRQFGNLTFTCHQNVAFNYSDVAIDDPRIGPFGGQPLFYLVRGHSCSGAIGSWSSGAPSERPGRDADLSVPHGTCP